MRKSIMFEGKKLFQYPATCNNSNTIFIDWFEDDDKAIQGYKEIMESQGYRNVTVKIDDITIVKAT